MAQTDKLRTFALCHCFLTRVLTRSSNEGQNADEHSISAIAPLAVMLLKRLHYICFLTFRQAKKVVY